MPGAIALPIDLNMLATYQTRMPLQELDAAVDQQLAIDPVETLDLPVLVGDQRRPVERRLTTRPAITLGLSQFFLEMRAVDQQLLRHASHVHAGATQVATFGNRHARTEAGGKTRRTDTTGAGANDEEVEIIGHSVVS